MSPKVRRKVGGKISKEGRQLSAMEVKTRTTAEYHENEGEKWRRNKVETDLGEHAVALVKDEVLDV